MNKNRSKQQESWFSRVEREPVQLKIDGEQMLDKLGMLHLTDFDLKLLKQIRPLMEPKVIEIAGKFYADIYEIKSLKKIIDTYSSVEKLSQTMAQHVLEFFDGVLDDAFLERRYRVGRMHYHIHLTPPYYMGAFQNLQNSMVAIVFANFADPVIAERLIQALNKMLSFEQIIVLEAYDQAYDQALTKEFEEGRNALRHAIESIGQDLDELTKQADQSAKSLRNHFEQFTKVNHAGEKIRASVKSQAASGFNQLESLLKTVNEAHRSINEMGRMTGQMKDSSNKINQVTLLVKSLAEQTNILAFNSAIEAARAGEYGKGFTVVSHEIRKLAEETNQAMVQITDLVTQSADVTVAVDQSLKKTMKIISEGVAASSQTSRQFREISVATDKSTALSETIENHMTELSEIVQALNLGIDRLSASTEQLMSNL
ncbi:MAG: protoglobin domain-containing protein [Sporolactobacillus sp.]